MNLINTGSSLGRKQSCTYGLHLFSLHKFKFSQSSLRVGFEFLKLVCKFILFFFQGNPDLGWEEHDSLPLLLLLKKKVNCILLAQRFA